MTFLPSRWWPSSRICDPPTHHEEVWVVVWVLLLWRHPRKQNNEFEFMGLNYLFVKLMRMNYSLWYQKTTDNRTGKVTWPGVKKRSSFLTTNTLESSWEFTSESWTKTRHNKTANEKPVHRLEQAASAKIRKTSLMLRLRAHGFQKWFCVSDKN